MKIGDLVSLVERYTLDPDGCRSVGSFLLSVGIVTRIEKLKYRAYPDVEVLWPEGNISNYAAFQLEVV